MKKGEIIKFQFVELDKSESMRGILHGSKGFDIEKLAGVRRKSFVRDVL